MSDRTKNIIVSVLSLSIGAFCYIVFRDSSHIAIFFDKISVVLFVRERLSFLSCDFIKYYLQDFLWALSLSCGIIAIYRPRCRGVFISAFSTFLFGCIWELLQYLGVVSGTGDWLDILMYLSASLISVLINKKRRD